ncbi:hypothetical protein [Hymenobacter sp. BRD67]|uniref:hypothetical protein n=1 Tax=Hymenobacter sp. BRD67 TaxID=2675877 RepID=UPI0015663916|nr:hypothetical protein [Hymenobacter sp. BRD67]QKG53867.1 hypothetical protein GKZ67_16250 [Hymenobacter sp. BRD67]
MTTPPRSFWQRPLVLATLSALLLSGGWPPQPIGPLALALFAGWVPYLLMERQLTLANARKGRVFAYTYWVLLLWNALTTWWVSYSSLPAGIAAVVLNALLMCLPLMAFRQTKKRLGNRLGYLSLPIYWIAFEQLHLHWDLTWPWLTLGNGFAAAPEWVQWYEYTGFLGGSVWVWVVNMLLFRSLIKSPLLKTKHENAGGVTPALASGSGHPARPAFGWPSSIFIPLLVIVLPIGLSYLIGASYHEKGPTAEVVVVQPNLDPYNEKFEGGPASSPPTSSSRAFSPSRSST